MFLDQKSMLISIREGLKKVKFSTNGREEGDHIGEVSTMKNIG